MKAKKKWRARKLWIFGIPGLVLVLTVPWAFTGDGGRWWGFPGWAVYSLAASVIYAAMVSWFLGWGWEASAQGPDWWKDEGEEDEGGAG